MHFCTKWLCGHTVDFGLHHLHWKHIWRFLIASMNRMNDYSKKNMFQCSFGLLTVVLRHTCSHKCEPFNACRYVIKYSTAYIRVLHTYNINAKGWTFMVMWSLMCTYFRTILEQANPQSQWYSCRMTGTFSRTTSSEKSHAVIITFKNTL